MTIKRLIEELEQYDPNTEVLPAIEYREGGVHRQFSRGDINDVRKAEVLGETIIEILAVLDPETEQGD